MRIIALILANIIASPAFAGEAEKSGGGLPQFDVNSFPTQVFWLFVMFAVVYVTVKNVIIPQIGGTIDTREEHIKHELQHATILTEKARQSSIEYDSTIKTSRANALKNIAAARDEVSSMFTKAEMAQRQQFQSLRDETMSNIARQKDIVLNSLEKEAKTLSSSLTHKLISGPVSGKNKKAAA